MSSTGGFRAHFWLISGMNVFRELVSQRMLVSQGPNFFSQVKVSDSHVKSVEMIANGTADVASIDCVSFSLLMDLRPDLTVRMVNYMLFGV